MKTITKLISRIREKSFPYLIFITTLLVCDFISAQPFSPKLVFEKLTIENGLSSSAIYSIHQDRTGFLWFGTEDGINRYDGYNFKVYRYQPGKINSLSGYTVNTIFEDSDGILWIGTRDGLNMFDPSTEEFTHFKANPDSSGFLSENFITKIFEDSRRNLWIGTKNGLNIFDRKKKIFLVYYNNPQVNNSISDNYVVSFLEDNNGYLWIGTRNGLNKYNYADKSFTVYKYNPQNNNSLNNNIIFSLFEDSNGTIWVGTYKGLNKIVVSSDNNELKFIRVEDEYPQWKTINNQIISSICEDDYNNLWIATKGSGLNIINREKNEVRNIRHQKDNIKSINSDEIRVVFKDFSGVIWIGHFIKGINSFNKDSGRFFHYKVTGSDNELNYSNDIYSILIDKKRNLWLGSSDNGINLIKEWNTPNQKISKIIVDNPVTSIIEDKYGDIWIGTFGSGLQRFNPGLKKSKVYKYDPSNHKGINNNFIHTLFEDKEGTIWIGSGLGGLIKYDMINDSFISFMHNPADEKSISSNEISVIYEDKDGTLWLGTTTQGINILNKHQSEFIRYKHNPEDINSISSQRINTIYQDNSGRIWIGTFSGGLNLFEKKTETFKHYTTENGLPGNTIFSIVEDNSGNLWLSTNKGLSKFNPALNQFNNYDASDGLQGEEFNPQSYFYDKEKNLIFFGGPNGLNIFNPDEIKENKIIPKLAVTDFQIFNHSVKAANRNGVQKIVTFSDEIEISYSDNIFSFEFAALHFSNPRKNQYAYKMEGFDKKWIYSGSRRFVTYTNLNPGNYTFKVKASNNDGKWTEKPLSINILISPPWWQTGWAYGSYIIIIVAGLFGVRRFEKNRMKLRNELKMHEFETQKLREVESMKSRFFANLSHEFRTPLMLIKGPVEKLLNENSEGTIGDQLRMINRNSINLQNLIDQLLELSQLEASAIPLKAKEENIIPLLKGLTFSFDSLAREKNITLKFVSNAESIITWIDKDKFEKIINNLLSNAFKFTNDGGRVSVIIELNDMKKFVEVIIQDSGIGIPENKIEKIFDRFFQADESGAGGSGIGLALVKELCELHKWDINVSSKRGIGTKFILQIPLGDHFNKNENNTSEKVINEELFNFKVAEPTLQRKIEQNDKEIKEGKPTILIVEDSKDVRTYLVDLLGEQYYLIQASNGREGIKSAYENSPDLIISDIMMPEMDGIEFCKKIKTDFDTSHIPVILLTAKVTDKSKYEGLETGADDYLTKPFDSKELFIRIKNLLEQRKRLKEKFSKDINVNPSSIAQNSVDKEFLEKAFSIAEKNLNNPEFDAESFAEELFMSLSQLRRKLKAVTNQAPGEFLRTYKLKRAAQMILEKKLSITQISLEIGFNSPSHFTKAFREQFNCLPSDFKG